MEFVIDRVSEDSFYENLFIGLQKTLEKLPNVSDFAIERSSPVAHNVICGWEQKQGVLLPEDIRQFYASTNGLLYTYNYDFFVSDDITIMGRIKINNLSDLNQTYGYEIHTVPAIVINSTNGNNDKELKLGSDSKLFEIENLFDMGRVVLVYLNHRYLPTVWMHNSAMKFYHLADDFTTYMRMCVHHLGIPLWQFSFTSEGVPEWSEMIFRLLAPGILNRKKKKSPTSPENDFSDIPLNKIDPAITRAIKLPHKTELSTIHHDSDPSPKSVKKKSKPTIKTSKKSSSLNYQRLR